MKYDKKARLLSLLMGMTFMLSTLMPARAFAVGGISEDLLEKDLRAGGFESFADEVFRENMLKYNIPGAVIGVVKDGKEVFSKGYGYTDADEKTAVDPDKTLFRIGSITKTFTETAVMQLAQAGKIDLNADVNGYLKGFKLNNPYPVPVTMAELLTHTSGIDSDEIGDLSHGKNELKPLNEVLSKRMLPVIREPGTEIEYSNYGISLAGCIVENVSGESCKEYITQNILDPLKMSNTSFTLEADDLAQGYGVVSGKLEKKALKGTFVLYPVGGLVSTADDMVKYMAAHLNYGEYNGSRILGEETSKLMQSRHEGFDEHLPGICYGFYERFINGERTIGHAGYSEDGFLSEMCLLPQHGTGVFIAVNQGSNNAFPQEFMKDFISRYYAAEADVSSVDTTDDSVPVAGNSTPVAGDNAPIAGDNAPVAGTYRFGQYTRSTLAKGDIFGAGEDVKVTANPDGSITLNGTDTFTGEKYASTAIMVSPLVYREANGGYVVFKVDGSGRVNRMAQTRDSWHGAYERITWYKESDFQMGLFLILLALSLFEVAAWLAYSIKHAIKKSGISESRITIVSRHLAGTGSLMNILFFVISMMTWGDRLRYGVPLDVKLLLCIPMITGAMTVFLAVACFLNMKYNEAGRFSKAAVCIAALTGLGFTWFYNYWNFLGFRF